MSEDNVQVVHSLKDLDWYRKSTYYLCMWLAQVQRFAEKLEKGEPFDKGLLVYAMNEVERYKEFFEQDKAKLGFTDGYDFLEDNEFIGFSIRNGRLISEVSNEQIFKVVDKWYYGFPATANHYQFEVAHYVVCLAEAEDKAKKIYPEETFGKNDGTTAEKCRGDGN